MKPAAVAWGENRLRANPQARLAQAGESQWPFRLVLLSLIFEFGRPQEIVPGLRSIPLPSIIDALIAISVFMSGKLNFENLQTKLWLPWLALMVVHTPLAVNNFHAAMTLKEMILLFSLYLGIITFVNTLDRVKTLVSVWLGLHVITAVVGIVQEGAGVGGWMGDENDFCMTINMVIPFAFFMVYVQPSPIQRFRYVGLLVLYVFTVMVTLSRGGFIGMAAAGAYCWFRSALKIGSVFVIGLLLLFMVAVAPEKYWEEIQSSFTEEEMQTGTGGDRLYIWGIGFEMFLANPIIGVGQGNFPWTFEEYEAGRTHMERSRAGRAAHSLYFTLMPEMGLVGVAIYLAMIIRNRKDISLIETLAKAKSESRLSKKEPEPNQFPVFMARAMEGSMIGFLVSSVFISTLWYPSFWVMMGFIVALRNVMVAAAQEDGVDVQRVMATGRAQSIPLPRLGTGIKNVRG